MIGERLGNFTKSDLLKESCFIIMKMRGFLKKQIICNAGKVVVRGQAHTFLELCS